MLNLIKTSKYYVQVSFEVFLKSTKRNMKLNCKKKIIFKLVNFSRKSFEFSEKGIELIDKILIKL